MSLLPLNFNHLNHAAVRFRLVLIAFLAGVMLASFYQTGLLWYIPAVSIVLAIVTLLRWPGTTTIMLIVTAFLFGVARYEMAQPVITPMHIAYFNGSQVSFVGTVTEEPDRRSDHTKLTITVQRLNNRPVSGRVLINANSFPEYQYGDVLDVNCDLAAPQPIEEFAYDRYLAKEGIHSICRFAHIMPVGHNQGNEAWKIMYRIKDWLQNKINNHLPEPQASLFSAITLGARRGLPNDLNEAFSITGTTHLIAISGLNMVIVVTMLMQFALALGLWRQQAFWAVSVGLLIYTAVIGFPASAVRAVIMAWLALFAVHLGRLSNASSAVLFAASGMVIINPLILRDDAGFQLSVAAVLGLIYLGPMLDRLIGKRHTRGMIYEAIKTTLAAQLATLPFIVWYFGRLSLIAPIANLVSVPIASWITILGLAALTALPIPLPISDAGFIFSHLLLSAMIEIIRVFSHIPYAAITL